MRILLADDHPQPRRALGVLLQREAGLNVVGEAEDADSLWLQVKALQPDLVLVDWGLAGAAPTRFFAFMRRVCPSLRLVVLSGWPEVRSAALDAGADAFVSKGDPPNVLLAAIRSLNANCKTGPPGPAQGGGTTTTEEGGKAPILRFAW